MSLSDTSLRAIIDSRLPETGGPRKRVIVVGAGMAGLVAAYELQRAGHEPVVLEAQQRVGGRVYTLREPFSDGLYAEAGAMRIPRSHDLTMGYIAHFGLPIADFTMDNMNGWVYLHGQKWRISDVAADPAQLGFEVADTERGRTHSDLWNAALKPLADRLAADPVTAWQEIVSEYDRYSTREFLEANNWSEAAIEMFGLLADQEALMNSSFLELLREETGRYYTDMVEVVGGSDHLPRAFLPALRDRIRFGARMIAIEQSPEDVTVHYQTAGQRFSVSGDELIVTVPFPVLRHIEVLPEFSRGKQRAIRQLHYDASAKILLQFRRRFWEEIDGIYGGGCFSDLPIRVTYYPDHGAETGRGVVLASYTWSEDAQRWGSLAPADRISQALENLARIHPEAIESFEVGASKMWHDDEFAG
ncbi:MAG TPA: FAD-dependent oxidoreductase, partial [Thermomicrobiales bacterium]|nr:FAD-dependent oxidoreductase [Thermomicrobiales bacterium]